jgi:hypothetical protein
VALSASDSQINIAPSVTVPAGAVTQDVPFTIGAAFNPLHVFAFRAQVGTAVAVAYGTVAQPGISSGSNFRWAIRQSPRALEALPPITVLAFSP